MLCGDPIYTWCYDAAGRLLASNCPHEMVLGTAFVQFFGKDQMLEHIGTEQRRMPFVIGTAVGMLWYAAYEYENEALRRCWTIGPVFYKDISIRQVSDALRFYESRMELSLQWKQGFFEAVKTVPVASNILMQRYILMLHYCLTGQRLGISDICLGLTAPEVTERHKDEIVRDRHKVYMTERALLDMVRNGDLNYAEALSNSMNISAGVPLEANDALRQAKTSLTVFISLVCRAAMEGGLSPEISYSLGDSYIQAAESAGTLDELSGISHGMYRDFIRRVHNLRANPAVSPQIRRCCDYIEMNIDKKLRAREVAEVVGYSEYYLTHRFKEEMGVAFGDYVKAAKIERAKTLLISTDDSTAQIAAKLSFGTRSYFSQIFTELTGISPQEYREKNQ